MNDKFMCLCFPEFSGKYVYDTKQLFRLSSGYYPRLLLAGKKVYWIIFAPVILLLSLSPTVRSELQPLALITQTASHTTEPQLVIEKSAWKNKH